MTNIIDVMQNGDVEGEYSTNGPTVVGYWSFNNAGSPWVGNLGQVPLIAYGLQNPVSPWTNALQVDNGTTANLSYRYAESNGLENIHCLNGAVSFWFKPDWNGSAAPGTNGQLLALGDGTNSLWSLYVDAPGSNILFQTGSNGVFITYFTNGIASFSSNTWYAVTLDYSTASTALYLNGLLAQSGPGITNYPNIADRMTYGFSLGSDHTGQHEAHACFDEVYTYDSPLSAEEILSNYVEGLLTANSSGGSGVGQPDWDTYNALNGLNATNGLVVFTPLK